MTSKRAHEKVLEFHEKFGAYISKEGTVLPSQDIRELRIELLREEFQEYLDAEEANDIVAVADALTDMKYIIEGTAISYGIPLEKTFDEVHNSNMSKLGEDGNPIYRDDGKVLKGPNYFKPDLVSILEEEKL